MTSLKYEHIEYFIEVCRSKSIAKAASSLLISQQALSSSIKRLERELGYEVFQRSVRGVQLTESGMRLYTMFHPIIHAYQNAVRRFKLADTGTTISFRVAIGVIHIIAPELLLSFCESHPDLKLNFNETSDVLFDRYILEDNRRFGIISAPEWLIKRKYSYIPLCVEPAHLVVHKSNPLSGMSSVSLAALQNEKAVLYFSNDFYRETLDHATQSLGFSIDPYYESTDLTVLLNMVNRGIGVFLCGKWFYDEAAIKESVIIPIQERICDYCTAFVFQDFAALDPLSQEYIRFIQTSINQTLPASAFSVKGAAKTVTEEVEGGDCESDYNVRHDDELIS